MTSPRARGPAALKTDPPQPPDEGKASSAGLGRRRGERAGQGFVCPLYSMLSIRPALCHPPHVPHPESPSCRMELALGVPDSLLRLPLSPQALCSTRPINCSSLPRAVCSSKGSASRFSPAPAPATASSLLSFRSDGPQPYQAVARTILPSPSPSE